MKANKGVGPNIIPTKILKDYKSGTSFTTVIFHSALKVASIIPIHKKSGKLDCDKRSCYCFIGSNTLIPVD